MVDIWRLPRHGQVENKFTLWPETAGILTGSPGWETMKCRIGHIEAG